MKAGYFLLSNNLYLFKLFVTSSFKLELSRMVEKFYIKIIGQKEVTCFSSISSESFLYESWFLVDSTKADWWRGSRQTYGYPKDRVG